MTVGKAVDRKEFTVYRYTEFKERKSCGIAKVAAKAKGVVPTIFSNQYWQPEPSTSSWG